MEATSVLLRLATIEFNPTGSFDVQCKYGTKHVSIPCVFCLFCFSLRMTCKTCTKKNTKALAKALAFFLTSIASLEGPQLIVPAGRGALRGKDHQLIINLEGKQIENGNRNKCQIQSGKKKDFKTVVFSITSSVENSLLHAAAGKLGSKKLESEKTLWDLMVSCLSLQRKPQST